VFLLLAMHLPSETYTAFLPNCGACLEASYAAAVKEPLVHGLPLTWAKVLWLCGLTWASVTLREIMAISKRDLLCLLAALCSLLPL